MPVPVIDKIRWVYPPTNPTLPPNNLVDDKIRELNDTVTNHKARLSSVTTFSQMYAQKHATLKFEYEQKVITLERTIADNKQGYKIFFLNDWKMILNPFTQTQYLINPYN